jgi:ADP-heptose:LPS heptosyltransferase
MVMNPPKTPSPRLPGPEAVRTLLIVRADRIGDHILGSSLFPVLRNAYPSSRIIVACPHELAELHTHWKEIDQIIPFDRELGHHSLGYRWSIILKLRRLQADLVINPQLARDKLSSRLAVYSGAKFKVGFDAENRGMMKPYQWRRYQAAFDLLCTVDIAVPGELDLYSILLRKMGIDAPVAPPRLNPAPQDEEFAARFFKSQPDSRRWFAFFAGTANKMKQYPGLGAVLRHVLKPDEGIIALGSAEDRQVCADELKGLPATIVNLCGQVSLTQAAALMKRCALAVGLDTGLAHLACAVGCPQVVVMGGYDFGRFFPYSPLTSLVCLPLDCYHCLGACRFSEIHCIRGIQIETVAAAIAETLSSRSDRSRIFFQKTFSPAPGNDASARPDWKLPDWLSQKNWEIRMV